jgi:hypothetical protein
LRKRAERTAVEEDTNINWDDEEEDQSTAQETDDHSISEELQEKLLSEYEKELKTTSPSTTKTKHSKKDSNGSDDWEKLSADSK